MLAEILRDALALLPEARAALIDSLVDSLDNVVDDGAEEALKEEIRHRFRGADSGLGTAGTPCDSKS